MAHRGRTNVREHRCDCDAEEKTTDVRPEGDSTDRWTLRSRDNPGVKLGDEPKE